MPADKNDPRHAQGGSGRTRGSGRSDHVSGLRDAIAFLNRESVALPDPGTPPWENHPPADPPSPAPAGPRPPLAPVRELEPPPGRPAAHALPPAPPPLVENALHFQGAQGAGRRQLPPPPPQAPAASLDDRTNRARHELALRFGGGTEYPPDPKPAQGIHAFSAVDWPGVDVIRKQVRERIAEQFPRPDSGTEEQRRAFGMAVIEEAVDSWSARAAARGQAVDDARQDAMRRAAGACVFGMGGLAPMLDHPDVETIEYRGCDDGHVV